MKARIGDKKVCSASNPTYIILEAGPTHYGLDSAKQLVDMAAKSGADAVKFQFLYADRLMADPNVPMTYKYLEIAEDGTENYVPITESLADILRRRELSKEEWIELKKHCDEQNITMLSTVTFEDEVDFLLDVLELPSLKLASADVNYTEFIRYCARRCAEKGANLQFDTGNADISEIERAVSVAEEEGLDNIIIHLCPTGYPARLESIHLNMITTLKQMFPTHSIAFSDHTPYWEMDIAAVALGADLVEKTITLDRTIKSSEHSFSLDRETANDFVEAIRNLETALGDSRRVIPRDEKVKRKSIRRSPYAVRDIQSGEIVKREDFEFRRPEAGLSAQEFDLVLGRAVVRDMKQNEALSIDDV